MGVRMLTDSELEARRRELDAYRRRRQSLGFRLVSPVRAAEHVLRRVAADRKLPGEVVSAVDVALPLVKTYGDRSRLRSASRVAVLASYSAEPVASRSLVTLIEEFESNGYTVVLVRASDPVHRPVWPEARGIEPIVIAKPNVGYDFGSWATALAVFPEIASMERVILVNDSLIGPFASLAPMIADFEQSASDVWGATDTLEYIPHLQSYLLGFTGGVLAHRSLRSFWRRVRVIDDKDAIVVRYEIGLSRLLAREGFLSRPWFSHDRIVPEGGNPTTVGGSRLVAAGFPFVKRILIDNPDIFPDANVATALVRERYRQDVADWV
jgi:hypothetical protein